MHPSTWQVVLLIVLCILIIAAVGWEVIRPRQANYKSSPITDADVKRSKQNLQALKDFHERQAERRRRQALLHAPRS